MKYDDHEFLHDDLLAKEAEWLEQEYYYEQKKPAIVKGIWIDNKGRKIEIHTMSNRWLNNIRKKCKNHPKIQLIKDELKRRKNKIHNSI